VRHEHFLLCGLDKCRVGKEEKQLVANARVCAVRGLGEWHTTHRYRFKKNLLYGTILAN